MTRTEENPVLDTATRKSTRRTASRPSDLDLDGAGSLLPYQVRRNTRPGMTALAARLTSENIGAFSFGTVMTELVRARDELIGHGVREGILDATEAATRRRLRLRAGMPLYVD